MHRPAPFDTTPLRTALFNLLRDHGIEAHHDWLSVRAMAGPGLREMVYVIVIGYAPAKAAMWPELDLISGQTQGKSDVGVWVLSPEQANTLCKKYLPAE